MATEKVWGDENLLDEILLRLDFPTCLVRASLTCKRWLGAASRPAFFRRFRKLHPPRLLGFYVVGDCVPRPEFVAVPNPPELAAVVRRGSFGFDSFPEFSSTIDDCRNGRLLIDRHGITAITNTINTHSPLALPHRHHHPLAPAPPPPTCLDGAFYSDYVFLPEDGGDGESYYRVDLLHRGRQVSAQISALRSGVWTVQDPIAKAELPAPPERIPHLILLLRGKLYMVTVGGYILGLDLAAGGFYVVELPQGVEYKYYGNLVLSRGNDEEEEDAPYLYLFHVAQGFQLQVWRRRMTAAPAADQWVLVVSVCLRETCGHLVQEQQALVEGFSVVGVADNGEMVFLEEHASGIVVLMRLGGGSCRSVEKVYRRDPDNDELIVVYPFMMVWPPVFNLPQLRQEAPDVPARNRAKVITTVLPLFLNLGLF